MALNATGPISIGGSTAGQSINLEFGRGATQQTSMSQLYRSGGVVPNSSSNSGVPTSGAISLSNFYGAASRPSQTITISTNQTNYVANTSKVTGYQAGIMDVTFVINSGIVVSGDTTGASIPAFDIDTSWAAGDTVTVVNNGFIIGRGGSGNGGAGGRALRAQRATSINNAGTIGGGGGGGGHGGTGSFAGLTAGAGGGGGGRSSSINAPGGAGIVANGGTGQNGSDGTFSSAGAGGQGTSPPGTTGGSGGAGGNWGANGNTGDTGFGTDTGFGLGQSGGSAGQAVSGNSNITWIATGTRLGAIT
jgi:hypothetical protein